MPLKLMSPDGPVNVCIRTFGLPMSTPDCLPSPKMVTNQFEFPWPLPLLLLLKEWVLLSWVPLMMSLRGFCMLTERLGYWSVPSPRFSEEIVAGTLDSQFVQSMRLFPTRPREPH